MTDRAKVPYATATSGMKAREEINRMLQRFGAEKVGWMDEYADNAVLLAFEHRGRQVQLRASAKGWAALYLRENPWTRRRNLSQAEYEKRAMEQGIVSVNSIIRDWVKGMITAIECGVVEFDAVFLPYMITKDGRSVAEIALDPSAGLLPPPKDENE